MDSRFKRCLDENKLVKVKNAQDLIEKELSAARIDIESAQASLAASNYKWAIVQAYYSMFHSAKALIYFKGYREKSHYCLSIALKTLYVDKNTLEEAHFNRFRDCMALRHDADYGMIYSKESSKEVVKWASEFLEVAKKLLSPAKTGLR